YGRGSALKLRVTLSHFTGAKLEYSTNGGTSWNQAQMQKDGGGWANTDTMDHPPFITWNQVNPGNNKLNPIGFGSSGPNGSALHFFIDNIKVGTDVPAEYNIGYINPTASAGEIPPYLGERYMDHVPKTLDLAERARLAIHGLTSALYPEGD